MKKIATLIMLLSVPAFCQKTPFGGYSYLTPLSVDMGYPSFADLHCIEGGIGIGRFIVGTSAVEARGMLCNSPLRGTKTQYFFDGFPLKFYYLFLHRNKLNLYGNVSLNQWFYFSSYNEEARGKYFRAGVMVDYMGLRFSAGYYKHYMTNQPYWSEITDTTSNSSFYIAGGIGIPNLWKRWEIKPYAKDSASMFQLACQLAGGGVGLSLGLMAGFAIEAYATSSFFNFFDASVSRSDFVPLDILLGAAGGGVIGFSTGIWGAGKLLKKKGSYTGCLTGTVLGLAIGSTAMYIDNYHLGKNAVCPVSPILLIGLPIIGGLKGFYF